MVKGASLSHLTLLITCNLCVTKRGLHAIPRNTSRNHSGIFAEISRNYVQYPRNFADLSFTLLFDQQLFLKHCPSAESAFFSYFFDTQIFTSFIEQRSFAHTENTTLAFFDECAEKVGLLPWQHKKVHV